MQSPQSTPWMARWSRASELPVVVRNFSVADGKGSVWINLEDKSQLVRMDSQTMKITNRWSVAPLRGTVKYGFRPARTAAYFSVAAATSMAVVDADNGTVCSEVIRSAITSTPPPPPSTPIPKLCL